MEEIKFFKIEDSDELRGSNGIYFVKNNNSESFDIMVIDKGVKRFAKYVNKHSSNIVTDRFSMQQENGEIGRASCRERV